MLRLSATEINESMFKMIAEDVDSGYKNMNNILFQGTSLPTMCIKIGD